MSPSLASLRPSATAGRRRSNSRCPVKQRWVSRALRHPRRYWPCAEAELRCKSRAFLLRCGALRRTECLLRFLRISRRGQSLRQDRDHVAHRCAQGSGCRLRLLEDPRGHLRQREYGQVMTRSDARALSVESVAFSGSMNMVLVIIPNKQRVENAGTAFHANFIQGR